MNNLIMAVEMKPWSIIPIIFVILGFVLTFLSIYVGRKYVKSDKVFNIILLIFSVFFVSMEVIHEVERFKEFGKYDWSSFPFQLCSVSMYLTILVPFFKDGKVKKSFIMFFALFTLLSGILPLIFGQGNLTRWPSFGGILFSFAWHILLMMVGGLSIGYANVGMSWKKEWKIILASLAIFAGITCIAQLLNFSIHTFVGGWEKPVDGIKQIGYIANYELDPDSCSLFYISPYFKSNIPVVFDIIWEKLGWVACWMIYIAAFSFGAVLIYLAIYAIRKSFNLLNRRFILQH